MDRTLSGAIALGLSGPGSDVKEGVLRISLSSSITGAWPSDYLVTYPGYSFFGGEVLPLCREADGVFYHPDERGLKSKT